LRRVTENIVKVAVRTVAASRTEIESDNGSFSVAKVWQINTSTISQSWVSVIRVAITFGITAHTKTVDTDFQLTTSNTVVERKANIFNIPTGNGHAQLSKARWKTYILFTRIFNSNDTWFITKIGFHITRKRESSDLSFSHLSRCISCQ